MIKNISNLLLWGGALAGGGSGGGGGSEEPEIGFDDSWAIKDGNTHIWITLEEGYTSPMLTVCPNGTVTVDWGDGTTPDVLTGTSTSTMKSTPNHQYAASGDYIITLTVDGEMGLKGHSTIGAALLKHQANKDTNNSKYWNAVRRVEFGSGVTQFGDHSFEAFTNLSGVIIPNSVSNIGGYAFSNCYTLKNIIIPDSVLQIGASVFYNCRTLESVVIPESVSTIGNSWFFGCYRLKKIVIPDSVTSIGQYAFQSCYVLPSAIIPKGTTSIGSSCFATCYAITSVVIPQSVSTLGSGCFSTCYGVRYYDFSKHTAVPTLAGTDVFSAIAADCEIRVPAALVDEWKAATNWATYADKIVGV